VKSRGSKLCNDFTVNVSMILITQFKPGTWFTTLTGRN